MLAGRLVRLIEKNSEKLARELSEKVWNSPRCSDLRKVPPDELQARTREIYQNLNNWLMHMTETEIEHRYTELGARRAAQGVAYSHFLWAITATREHMTAFVQREGFSDTPMQLQGELELMHILAQFFDRANSGPDDVRVALPEGRGPDAVLPEFHHSLLQIVCADAHMMAEAQTLEVPPLASALAGLRVLDLTQHIAGPYATKLLADNGADVIKIEPPRGDIARTLGPFPGDEPGPTRSALFTVLNAGKRAMTLDLQSESVRAVFAEMAAGADLVVESFRPGTLAKLGFSYEELTRLNPRVVLVSISNFGQTGPFSQYEGSDLTLYAIGAELHSVGIMGREPVKQHGTSMLYQSGAIAAGAAMGAAFAARRDGIGQWVDVAITETHAAGVDRRSETLIGYNYTGRYAERTEGVALGLPAGVVNTVTGPGSDSAILRIKGTTKAIALSVDCNSRYCYLDPYVGAMTAVVNPSSRSPSNTRRGISCS